MSFSIKQRILERLEQQCINRFLHIVSEQERNQYQNREVALSRLQYLLRKGLQPDSDSRKATRPTYASQKRKISTKRHRAILKQKRRRNFWLDD